MGAKSMIRMGVGLVVLGIGVAGCGSSSGDGSPNPPDFAGSDASTPSFVGGDAGIDDSLKAYVYNSKYPGGASPDWAASPGGAGAGVCQGNGTLTFDFGPYVQRGEVNAVVLAHADLNCAISALDAVDITNEDKP